jgi:hypothetical protein
MYALLWLLVLLPLLKACAPPPDAGVSAEPTAASAPAATTYKAVLIAGDGRLRVFDNAVTSVGRRLRDRGGSAPGDIQRLSAAPAVFAAGGVRSATLDHVLGAIAAMRPRAGQGCFVFATSHGSEEFGLSLQLNNEFLNPGALDRALVQGCGDAPTVVIMSGCFTGIFAQPPMTRPNRVVLTAARPDRTSFGCGAGRVYTAFDKCLLDAMDAGGTWPGAYASVQRCVVAEERRNHATPSEPQAWFGPAVAGLPLPMQAVAAQP